MHAVDEWIKHKSRYKLEIKLRFGKPRFKGIGVRKWNYQNII